MNHAEIENVKPGDGGADTLAIRELSVALPPEVIASDPAQSLADSIVRVNKLRELMRDRVGEEKKARRGLLLKLLEIADALDRILAIVPDPSSPSDQRRWNSVRVTRRMVEDALRRQNVTALDLLGKPADPNLCEVDSYQVRPELPHETVVQEVVKAYLWEDEVLRQGVVIISHRE
jgi:molecular chaperone GrpE (heat shock protein)